MRNSAREFVSFENRSLTALLAIGVAFAVSVFFFLEAFELERFLSVAVKGTATIRPWSSFQDYGNQKFKPQHLEYLVDRGRLMHAPISVFFDPGLNDGATVPIRYEPDDPSNVCFDNFWGIYGELLATGFVNALAFAVSVFFIWRARNSHRAQFGFHRLVSAPLELFFMLERSSIGSFLLALTMFKGRDGVSARKLMLAILVKMAHADGSVTDDEAVVLENCACRWFSESKKSQIDALQSVREIKRAPEKLEDYTRVFASLFSWSAAMRANAFDLLSSIVFADGIVHPLEDKLLRNCAAILQVSLDEYERLLKQYSRNSGPEQRSEEARPDSHDSFTKQRQSAPKAPRFDEHAHWADVLGCSSSAPMSEIKRCYRKLVMLYHPDRLKADTLPPEQRQFINTRFVRIQRAFEEAEQKSGSH